MLRVFQLIIKTTSSTNPVYLWVHPSPYITNII